MKLKIILTVIISLLIILLFTGIQLEPQNRLDAKRIKLLLIPLDNRPANTYFPYKISKIGNIDLFIPSNLEYEDIKRFVFTHIDNADGVIISVDQLAYGGLVESREYHTNEKEAISKLGMIKEIKEKYPNKLVYVYDTIQRITPTVKSLEDKSDYNNMKKWAILYDQVNNFNFLEKEGELKYITAKINPTKIKNYWKARKRNYTITYTLLKWVADEYINYLIIGQDDASYFGPHREEKEKLLTLVDQYQINDKVTIFPGADELDMILITRASNILHHFHPKYKIIYQDIDRSKNAYLEDIPLELNMIKHINAIHASVVEKDEDITIYINPKNLGDITENNILIYVQDDTNIFKNIGNISSQTLAFANWNTAGNTIGIALSQGTLRYYLLKSLDFKKEERIDAAKSHLEFMLSRYLEDYFYKKDQFCIC